MSRFTCDWIFNILVVLCDGRVVCGCADPAGERPLGRLTCGRGLREIWNSPQVQEIRAGLNEGYAPFCRNCGLKRFLAEDEIPPQRPLVLERLPRIFLEPTVLCNLSCLEAVCSHEAQLPKTRERPRFPREEFATLLGEIGDGLVRLDFFNYGEPFLHPEAADMIEYLKERYPQVYLYVSTNGLMLTPETSRRVIAAGVDEITFSIDGADQATYEKYRRGGDLRQVLAIVRDFVAERNRQGREVPVINWRSILFRWNDSWWHRRRIRRLAERAGVDRLTWEITDHPASAVSKEFYPGAPALARIRSEIWDSSQIGNALKKKTYRGRLAPLEALRPLAAEKPGRLAVRVKNTGGMAWHRGGRHPVRLGAQLHDEEHCLIDLNWARAFLPTDLPAGGQATVELDLPVGAAPGRYLVKLDLVLEGVDWFENGGSPVVWLPLTVVS